MEYKKNENTFTYDEFYFSLPLSESLFKKVEYDIDDEEFDEELIVRGTEE